MLLFSVLSVHSKGFLSRPVHRTFSSVRDTIYAVSSGPIVKAGVSVIRISGPSAYHCIQTLCKGTRNDIVAPEFRERKASLRHLYCPATNDKLDQALVLWFPSPNSFTGEDVAELHVHGSRAVVLGVLSALDHLDRGSSGGIRPADKGEFTRRAFDNGRMDLTEVEGLADLLEAQTAVQRKQALSQMEGHLSRTFDAWRNELVGCLSHTEAVIDFGDDDRENDISDAALAPLVPRVTQLLTELQRHLQDGGRGEIVRDGVRIALVGPPNAGKSSLLNALARRPAAIVSPIAGTTRDVVAVQLDLAGVPCLVSDTAGLRLDSADPVELEGMRRTREASSRAHIRLLVVDSSPSSDSVKESLQALQPLLLGEGGEDMGLMDNNEKVLVVLNKSDLRQSSASADEYNSSTLHSSVSVSCVTGSGIAELEAALSAEVGRLLSSGAGDESPIITRQRHRRHVQQCVRHLERFLHAGLAVDTAAEELRLAMRELGKVTGVVDVEELLDVMFRDFCIGK